MKILFIIDKIEFKYFEFNELITSFWFIKECLERNFEVYVTTMEKLYLHGNMPCAISYKTSLTNSSAKSDFYREDNAASRCLNDFNIVLFRPDPPVTMEYIFGTYILDYVDKTTTKVVNDPQGIRKANEKLYINHFQKYIPDNITTSNDVLIKDFVNNYGEAVLKPLNRCFGKGVYYLKKGDKNINTIIDIATNSGETPVMVQDYIKNAMNRDKRIILLGGKPLEQSIVKLSGNEDFKFNAQKDENFVKACLSDKERELCGAISSKLDEDGLYLVGLDVMDEKLIEINVTSPCFFIKEINSMFDTQIEKQVVNYLEDLAIQKDIEKADKNLISCC